jgi:hypothetical protein
MQNTMYFIGQGLTSLIYIILSTVMLSILVGIFYKIFFALLSIAAFPTYLGLYIIENFAKLKLNRAKKGTKALIMDACAAMVTVYSCILLWPSIVSILPTIGTSKLPVTILEASQRLPATFSSPIPPNLATPTWTTFILLVIIYTISFFEDADIDEPVDKIKNLSADGPWKKLLGS